MTAADSSSPSPGSLFSHVQPLLVLLTFLAGIVAYGPMLTAFFVSDDFNIIGQVIAKGPFGIWAEAGSGFFRPLVSLSFYIDHLVWGLNPFGYHLTNVVIHSFSACLCAWVVSLVTRGQGERTGHIMAALVGACFLLAPNHTETVSWISGRTDVIATSFVLCSVVSYLLIATYGPTRARIAACLVFFACALLSKESAIALPFVLAAHALLVGRRTMARRTFISLGIGLGGVVVIYIALRAFVIGRVLGGYGARAHLDVFNGNVPRNLATFMSRSLLPPGLSIDYVLVGYAVWGVLVVTALWPVMRRSWAGRSEAAPRSIRGPVSILAALALAAQASMAPVLNFAVSAVNSSSERFLYLSSAFVITFAGAACVSVFRKLGKFSVLPLIIAMVFYTIHLRRSNENWSAAARITASVVRSLKSLQTNQQVLVLNVPANINGAYVFQAGFRDVVDLLGLITSPQVGEPLLHHAIHRATDRVSATRVGQGFALRFLDDGMWVEYVSGDFVTVTSDNGRLINIEATKPMPGNWQVLYYSANAMHELK